MAKNKILTLFLSGIIFLTGIITCLFFNSRIFLKNSVPVSKQTANHIINKGIWITVFSEKRVLYSKEAIIDLIELCKKTGINEIYLQLYRSGQVYYDSKISNRTKYDEILKIAGIDTIDFLLKKSQESGIKVFAWVNVLSLAQNKKADVITKFGTSVLTKDQYLRTSIRSEGVNESDKYYLRDDQIFLEPGDPRVAEYVISIIDEIIDRYPLLSGIHLDYIRYPYSVPCIPDSRFIKYGLTYGYGENNIELFRKATGISPLGTMDNDDSLRWDNWKRERITSLVEGISKSVKTKSPNLLVSCAVVPSSERAYACAFQDWPLWLEMGIIDYVVLMNYTRDNRLALETTKSALAYRGNGQVYVGLGVFLMKDKQEAFFEQYNIVKNLEPDGIVLFSYDDITDELLMSLRNTPSPQF